MNLGRYMRAHESRVRELLCADRSDYPWAELFERHARILSFIQHERLVHLLVTLAFGLFLLLSAAIVFVKPSAPLMLLAGLFLIMLVAYVIHYFFLENSVQRWYLLTDKIGERVRRSRSVAVDGKPSAEQSSPDQQ